MGSFKKIVSFRFRLVAGFLIWLGWSVFNYQFPLHANWGRMLLLLAPLALVPMALNLLSRSPFLPKRLFIIKIEKWTLPASACLVVAYMLDQGELAGALALPWLAVTLAVTWAGICTIQISKTDTSLLALSFGMVYLSVGGLWAVADRMGWRPLGYDPEIVFLTVAHFHYAGFVLPIVAGFVVSEIKNGLTKVMAYGILIGVWLVAAGIVASQMGGGPTLECFAAWWLATAAMLLAFFQIKIVLRRETPANVAICFSIAGVALLAGMLLAGLYGMRYVYPIPGLDIPMMRALHGSANVFGFGMFAILGWWLYMFEKGKTTE